MACYQRKIAYLDYLENGMKIKNAGFIKAEDNNGQVRLEMRVKNIPQIFTGEYELNADVGGTIGRISLNRGTGGCCVVWNNGTKVPEGRQKVKANGVYVRLPGRHLVQAVWNEPVEVLVDGRKEENPEGMREDKNPEASVPVGEIKIEPEATTALTGYEQPEVSQKQQPMETEQYQTDMQPEGEKEIPVYPSWEMAFEPHMQISSVPQAVPESPAGNAASEEEESWNGSMPQTKAEFQAIKETDAKSRDRTEKEEGEAVCYGDKWEQLSHMYPLTHPFGDEREYLTIAPKDFVVLRQEYQKMVHNSFLLHGYYNYKHLILGKLKEKGEWCYYLGVPGNFYNREKMVAEMFGFEAFEGEKDSAEPGDFGYFMKKVEI